MIEEILSKLQGLKNLGHGRWMALCPVHNEKTPSLSIRGFDDGRVLLHCFGCGAGAMEILGSIEVKAEEMFPPSRNDGYQSFRRNHRIEVACRSIGFETMVILIGLSRVNAGKQIADSDLERYALAGERIIEALEVCGINLDAAGLSDKAD